MAANRVPQVEIKRRKMRSYLSFPDKNDANYEFVRPLYDASLKAEIVGVEWERFYLFLDIAVEGAQSDAEFFLVIAEREGLVGAKLKEVARDGQRYRVMLDITNDGHHRCVRPETYYLYVLDSSERWNEATLSAAIGADAPSWTRLFPFAAATQGYTVWFDLDKESERPVPLIRIQSVVHHVTDVLNRDKHRVYEPIKDGKVKLEVKRDVIKSFYRARRLKHLQDLKNPDTKPVVVFVSEQDDHLKSNLLAVHNRMLERGLDEYFDIRTACREATGFRRSYKSWLSIIDAYAAADFIFLDDFNSILDWLHLDESTVVVELWHAGAGFKSSGYARWGRTGAPRPYSAHRQNTYGISGSRKIRHFFSEVFGINEERILPLGMPRMDEYLDPGYRSRTTTELLERFPMAQGKKVILFAPTYRGVNKPRAMYPYEMIDFEGLYDACGNEWVMFFKMHPWVKEGVPIPEEYRDKMMDLSDYPNINDLFYITELLVSDYSSNIFEYSLMRKPMLFFAFDEMEYSFVRGFHRPYEESVAGKICRTPEELVTAIREKDFEAWKVDEYVEKHFDFIDCGASDRVIDWIILGQMPEEIVDAIAARDAENERVEHLLFDRTPLLLETVGYAVDDEGRIIEEWTPEGGAVVSDTYLYDSMIAERKRREAERKAAREGQNS